MKLLHIFLAFQLFLFSTETRAEGESNWFVNKSLYPVYLADPHQLNFHILYRNYSELTIPDTGSTLIDLKAGVPLIIYERKSDNPEYGWQLIFLGGLRSQFDPSHELDSVAWEGYFGLQAVYKYHDNFVWRFGTKHYSSHLGDEYIERTGRTRINYTRNEVRAGLAWMFQQYSTYYVDVAITYEIGNAVLQEPWRVQTGLQYEQPGVFFDGQVGWYSAIDLSAYEEDNWDMNMDFQIGLYVPVNDRRWRFGIEYYDGRSQYGEFFQNREKYTGVGIWIDF